MPQRMEGETMLPPVSLPMEKADEAGGGGGAGAGAGAGGAFFEEPGIHGLAAEPDVVEGERAEAEFGDEDGAGVR